MLGCSRRRVQYRDVQPAVSEVAAQPLAQLVAAAAREREDQYLTLRHEVVRAGEQPAELRCGAGQGDDGLLHVRVRAADAAHSQPHRVSESLPRERLDAPLHGRVGAGRVGLGRVRVGWGGAAPS